MGRTACTESQCLYKGALYYFMDLYMTLQKVVNRDVVLLRSYELEATENGISVF
jgi:hypothetical protein